MVGKQTTLVDCNGVAGVGGMEQSRLGGSLGPSEPFMLYGSVLSLPPGMAPKCEEHAEDLVQNLQADRKQGWGVRDGVVHLEPFRHVAWSMIISRAKETFLDSLPKPKERPVLAFPADSSG